MCRAAWLWRTGELADGDRLRLSSRALQHPTLRDASSFYPPVPQWHACGGVQCGTAITTWSKPTHKPFGLSQRSNSAIVAGRREISMSSFILDQVEGYSVTRAARTCDSEAAARIVLR